MKLTVTPFTSSITGQHVEDIHMLGLFTLQMNLALRALEKDWADGVQIVVAAASQRARPSLRHLQQNGD